MKIKLNPEYYVGFKQSDGIHCEWFLSDDKVEGNYYTFEPCEDLPITKQNGSSSCVTHRFYTDEEFKEMVDNGNIIVIEDKGIRFDKPKHDFK